MSTPLHDDYVILPSKTLRTELAVSGASSYASASRGRPEWESEFSLAIISLSARHPFLRARSEMTEVRQLLPPHSLFFSVLPSRPLCGLLEDAVTICDPDQSLLQTFQGANRKLNSKTWAPMRFIVRCQAKLFSCSWTIS